MKDYKKINEDMVIKWTAGFLKNLLTLTDILNGSYDLNKAREDILSFDYELDNGEQE